MSAILEPERITSRSNERLINARKVRDGKIPDQIFIEGLRLAEEALRSSTVLLEAFVTPAFSQSERGGSLVLELTSRKVRLSQIDESLIKTLADTKNPQGIVIIAKRPQTGVNKVHDAIHSPGQKLLLFLNEINDPSNFGAVARTAEAAGVSGLILSEHSTDPFSPKALRAAMGSNLRLPIWDRADIKECIDWSRAKALQIVAADTSGKTSYLDIDWQTPSLIIFGSEAHGLNDDALKQADGVVTIPLKNAVESLNLAVSAGIILFEAIRQYSSKA